MVTHHPDAGILADFSAGNLGMSPACCVAVHLEYCADCQRSVERFDAFGGEALKDLPASAVDPEALPSLLRRLSASPTQTRAAASRTARGESVPRALVRLLPNGTAGIHWKKHTASLKSALLCTGDDTNQLSLLRMRAGRSPGRHDHSGSEWTVVLQGGFSDRHGVYGPGDFVALAAGDVHQPVAHQNEDCICLASQDAPIRLTGWVGRFVNSSLRIAPA
jgi:putative transcriptional regulator